MEIEQILDEAIKQSSLNWLKWFVEASKKYDTKTIVEVLEEHIKELEA